MHAGSYDGGFSRFPARTQCAASVVEFISSFSEVRGWILPSSAAVFLTTWRLSRLENTESDFWWSFWQIRGEDSVHVRFIAGTNFKVYLDLVFWPIAPVWIWKADGEGSSFIQPQDHPWSRRADSQCGKDERFQCWAISKSQPAERCQSIAAELCILAFTRLERSRSLRQEIAFNGNGNNSDFDLLWVTAGVERAALKCFLIKVNINTIQTYIQKATSQWNSKRTLKGKIKWHFKQMGVLSQGHCLSGRDVAARTWFISRTAWHISSCFR